jgi:tetratricopeptide (TPR) repeat protein
MPYLGSATLEDVLDRAWPPSPAAPRGPEQIKAERPRKADVIPDALRACAQPEDPPPGPVDSRLRAGSYADGVIHLAAQLAEALAFLHAQGVCHCDLKPSNVLLDPSGKPLLLDFNLSTSAREATQPSGGTLRYMAPELLRAYLTKNWEGLDERAELFALAVLVYELLAGDHPHGPIPAGLNNEPLAQFLLGRMTGRFRPLREVCPDVERPVARALDRCLAFDPADRPPSAAELAAELKRQFSPARRTRRWIARHPLAVLSALCLLLGGTVAAGLAWSVTPPYGERQYQLGKTAYRAGDYAEAERCFERAFGADPKNARYRFARGVARLKQSKYLTDGSEKLDQAWNDIKEIADGQMDDRTMALKAYNLNREQKAEEAIEMYTKLLQGRYWRAMVLNNRAYSYLLRNNPDGFDLAVQDLDEAVQLDPHCQAIRYNRAKAVLFRCLLKLSTKPKPVLSIPQQTLDDIDRAIQLGPTTWELYSHAAELYAFAAREDLDRYVVAQAAPPSLLGSPLAAALHSRGQQRVESCLSYLSQAIASGDSAELPNHPVFKFLRPHFAFPANPPFQARSTVPALNLCLIEPVELPD